MVRKPASNRFATHELIYYRVTSNEGVVSFFVQYSPVPSTGRLIQNRLSQHLQYHKGE